MPLKYMSHVKVLCYKVYRCILHRQYVVSSWTCDYLNGTPFFVHCRFENDLIVAVGKGEPAEVMSEYGFR
jgi:hypothetical protein